MRTVRRLLYREIIWSVAFVAAAFLGLFFFIDFVDEIEQVGRDGFSLWHAVARSLLALPGHFYELFPISVLIGSIYSMARLAQSSEFTILRTGGLGPGRALWLLAIPGLAFAVLTFVVGDFVAPATGREAVLVKAGAAGLPLGRSGAWLKERRSPGQAEERSITVNVAATGPGSQLRFVRIFEFDASGRLRTRIEAARASVGADGHWELSAARRTDWPTPEGARNGEVLTSKALANMRWPSSLDSGVVAAALLPVQTMSTAELWRYSSHLADQDQAAQRHEIQFWKKALYPLACVVMMALALPFAYLHARAGGVSFKVFGGIMLGISFVLLNNVSGHLGLLRDWTPWMVAAAPSTLYLLLSMAAFSWLVRYR